jgi:hypothetical protein
MPEPERIAATLAVTSELTPDERDRLFYRNTVRTYRIDGGQEA